MEDAKLMAETYLMRCIFAGMQKTFVVLAPSEIIKNPA